MKILVTYCTEVKSLMSLILLSFGKKLEMQRLMMISIKLMISPALQQLQEPGMMKGTYFGHSKNARIMEQVSKIFQHLKKKMRCFFLLGSAMLWALTRDSRSPTRFWDGRQRRISRKLCTHALNVLHHKHMTCIEI